MHHGIPQMRKCWHACCNSEGMKTFTSLLTLVGSIAGVVVPGFAAAGVSIPFAVWFIVGVAVLAVVGYALISANSVDQVRTGSPFATNYRVQQRPPVAHACRTTRRVRAIIEIAA